jgi:acyl carrier protein
MNQPTLQQTPNAEQIQAWLVSQVAEQLKIKPEEIDPEVTFESYGLTSAQAMSIATKAEQILGFQPAPMLLWHYPTVKSLSERLAEEFEDAEEEILSGVDPNILDRELAEIEKLSSEQTQTELNSQS